MKSGNVHKGSRRYRKRDILPGRLVSALRAPGARDPDRSPGGIDFRFGRCRITADAGQQSLHVERADPRQVDSAEQLLSEHLLRVTRDESLPVHWQPHGL